MKLRNKIKQAANAVRSSAVSSECSTYQDCLEQAEICSSQAREAARLRRYKAARGLFSTATELYRRAIELAGGVLPDAQTRMHQIDMEASAYLELARSMERPLMTRTDRKLVADHPAPGVHALQSS